NHDGPVRAGRQAQVTNSAPSIFVTEQEPSVDHHSPDRAGRAELAPLSTEFAAAYFSLAAFRIGSSRAASLLTSSPSAFGPRRPGSMGSAPSSARRFCTVSSPSPLMSASESLSMMGCGVPAGANRP